MDRKIAPPIKTVSEIDYLKAKEISLTNGIPLYYLNAGDEEVVKMDFVFEAGAWQQHERLLAGFTVYMLQEGTKKYTASEIAEKFDYCGSYIHLAVDQNFALVSIISLNKHLPEIMEVLEDVIKHPVFPLHGFEVLREKQKQKFLLENEKVKTLCQKKFSAILFGEEHPYCVNNAIEDFDKLDREKLRTFHSNYYHANNCRIVVAGRVTEDVLSLIEEHFGSDDWSREKQSEKSFDITPAEEKYHHVKKENGMQSAIRMGRHWVHKSHPDYDALAILVAVLGGYFGSRLMANIREDKGYTYGIGAYVIGLKNASYMVISTEVGNEYLEGTLSEINKELTRLQTELIPNEELETVKSYLIGEFLRDFDGPFALASSFKSINDFGLDYDFYDKYLKTVNTITPERIQQLAKEYLSLDDMFTVVAGA